MLRYHAEQFSMAFQDCHETGVREELRTEFQAFKIYERSLFRQLHASSRTLH